MTPLIVYRIWSIAPGPELWSPSGQGMVWHPGANRARCGNGHRAPERNCSCGLYGYRQLDLTHEVGPGELPQVLGAALAAGRVQQHKYMVRAEVMKVIAFQWPPIPPRSRPPRPLDLPFTADRLALKAAARQAGPDLRRLADLFWVPVFRTDQELIDFAQRSARKEAAGDQG